MGVLGKIGSGILSFATTNLPIAAVTLRVRVKRSSGLPTPFGASVSNLLAGIAITGLDLSMGSSEMSLNLKTS
jgi:hypothetical protein